jgi:hypothetical protein
MKDDTTGDCTKERFLLKFYHCEGQGDGFAQVLRGRPNWLPCIQIRPCSFVLTGMTLGLRPEKLNILETIRQTLSAREQKASAASRHVKRDRSDALQTLLQERLMDNTQDFPLENEWSWWRQQTTKPRTQPLKSQEDSHVSTYVVKQIIGSCKEGGWTRNILQTIRHRSKRPLTKSNMITSSNLLGASSRTSLRTRCPHRLIFIYQVKQRKRGDL